MSETTPEIAGAYEQAHGSDRDFRDESISNEIDAIDRLVAKISEPEPGAAE